MKKVSLLIVAVIMIFSIFVAGCGSKDTSSSSSSTSSSTGDSTSTPSTPEKAETSKKKHDLKMSVTVGHQSTWYMAAEQFANEVNEKTDGRITISIFPNEQLSGGDSGKGIELLIRGNTDLSYHSTIIYSIMDERFGVVSAPFLFKDFDAVDRALAGSGGEAVNKLLREVGVEPLGFGQNGFRQATNNERPIHSPDDINGLKMRIPGIKMYIDLWQALGADPTTMTFSEVFPSLQQGVIDGQENPVDVIYSAKLNEVQKYVTMFNYSYDPLILGMNKKLFDEMDAEDQEIIRAAAANANQYQIKLAREKEEEQIASLEEAGMEFYYPTAEELAAFQKAVEPVYEKYESIWGTELLNSFR